MVNHTHDHLPGPVDKLRIDVKQRPGFSYPKPPSHARITESNWLPPVNFVSRCSTSSRRCTSRETVAGLCEAGRRAPVNRDRRVHDEAEVTDLGYRRN